MTQREIFNFYKQDIIQKFLNGQSITSLAKEYNCNRKLFAQYLRELGYHTQKVAIQLSFTLFELEEIFSSFSQGESVTSISARYHCDRKKLGLLLREAGYQTKKIVEPKRIVEKISALDKLKQQVSKEQMYEDLIILKKTKTELHKQYHCSLRILNYCLKDYGILDIYNSINSFNITKEELHRLYIDELLSKQEIADLYNTTRSKVETKLEKYKIEKPMELRVASYKRAMLKKYGTDNCMKVQEFQDRLKKSFIQKYGVDNAMKDPKTQAKGLNTLKERYGTYHPLLVPEFKEKAEATCLAHYGVAWPTLVEGAIKGHHNDSKPNLHFQKILISKFPDLSYEREWVLEKYSYDFKIEDILFEINPTITHNIAWSPFGSQHKSRINENYHINKQQIAAKYGFFCINLWDWDNLERIIDLYFNHREQYNNLFIKTLNNQGVIEYCCDNSKINVNELCQQGYTIVRQLPAQKHYFNPQTKLLFQGEVDEKTMSEQKLIEQFYLPVYDCGYTVLIKTQQ